MYVHSKKNKPKATETSQTLQKKGIRKEIILSYNIKLEVTFKRTDSIK